MCLNVNLDIGGTIHSTWACTYHEYTQKWDEPKYFCEDLIERAFMLNDLKNSIKVVKTATPTYSLSSYMVLKTCGSSNSIYLYNVKSREKSLLPFSLRSTDRIEFVPPTWIYIYNDSIKDSYMVDISRWITSFRLTSIPASYPASVAGKLIDIAAC